jgi:hypothetical protein
MARIAFANSWPQSVTTPLNAVVPRKQVPNTSAGRRYLESATNGWRFQLFVRVSKEDAYYSCGPAYIARQQDVTGNRPMNIEWTLEMPLPPRMFAAFSVLRGQA